MSNAKQQQDAVEQALGMLHPRSDDRAVLPELDDFARRRMADDILTRFDARRKAAGRRAAVLGVAAALLVAAVSAAVVLQRSPGGQEPSLPASRQAVPTPATEVPIAQQMDTREGPATFSLPTGIAVELAPRTSLRVLLADGHRYGVTLLRGMALFSVDPRQARTGFFVDTPAGTVRVTGTLFTVVVSDASEVSIALHRGRVAWVSAGRESAVATGELVSADETGVAPLADGALDEVIDAQLQAVRCGDKRALFTELTGGCDSGTEHREPDGKAKRTGNALGELMAQARSHRADGDWAGAAAVYRRVMEQYPASSEARTSMISLGQIQLRHLGDPAGARRQFSAYLKRPGPLTEEALYGQAGACRSMGDKSGEAASLRRLQSAFPTGIYAGAAASRLSALQKESP